MRKSRFTEDEIVSILKEADSGAKVSEICRKHGISDATFYNWRSTYRTPEGADLKRMKEMESALSQLKRLYAELALEHQALKDSIERKD